MDRAACVLQLVGQLWKDGSAAQVKKAAQTDSMTASETQDCRWRRIRGAGEELEELHAGGNGNRWSPRPSQGLDYFLPARKPRSTLVTTLHFRIFSTCRLVEPTLIALLRAADKGARSGAGSE